MATFLTQQPNTFNLEHGRPPTKMEIPQISAKSALITWTNPYSEEPGVSFSYKLSYKNLDDKTKTKTHSSSKHCYSAHFC